MRQRHHLFFPIIVGIFILLEFSLYLSLSLFFPVNRHPYCSISTPIKYNLLFNSVRFMDVSHYTFIKYDSLSNKVHLMLDMPHSMLIDHSYPIKLTLASDDTALTLAETSVDNENKTITHTNKRIFVRAAPLYITDSGNYLFDLPEGKVFNNVNGHNAVGVWSLTLRWQRTVHLQATLLLNVSSDESPTTHILIEAGTASAEWDMICVP